MTTPGWVVQKTLETLVKGKTLSKTVIWGFQKIEKRQCLAAAIFPIKAIYT